MPKSNRHLSRRIVVNNRDAKVCKHLQLGIDNKKIEPIRALAQLEKTRSQPKPYHQRLRRK